MLKPIIFDWDVWNIQKNELKHGVSTTEAESAFCDPHHVLFEDVLHATPLETRWLLLGMSVKRRILMIGFTVREGKIRIITARAASRRERRVYEEESRLA